MSVVEKPEAVVIIDDSRPIRSMLSANLEDEGLRVEGAGDVDAAIELLDRLMGAGIRISHLILDRNFPGRTVDPPVLPPRQVIDALRDRPALRPELGRIGLLPYSDQAMPLDVMGVTPADVDKDTGWLTVHETSKQTEADQLINIILGDS